MILIFKIFFIIYLIKETKKETKSLIESIRPDTFRKCKQTLAKIRHVICKDKLTPGL